MTNSSHSYAISPIPKLKQTLPPNSILKTPDQWIFSHEEIELYYSYGDTPEEHIKVKDKREKGIAFLQQVGHKLALPQTTLAAAATFFHRFYMRNNFTKYHQFDIAATCLFVSCKTEETIQKVNRLSETCALIAMKGKLTESTEIEKEASRWKKIILTQEPNVCEAITFDFYLEHPLRPLLQFLQSLEVNQILVQFSLSFLMDSLRTTVVLQYQPTHIAAACIYLASQYTNETLPENWMTKINVSKYTVLDAATQILEIYDSFVFSSSSSSTQRSSYLSSSTTRSSSSCSSSSSSSNSTSKLSSSSNSLTSTSLSSQGSMANGSDKKVRISLEEFKLRKSREEQKQFQSTTTSISSTSSSSSLSSSTPSSTSETNTHATSVSKHSMASSHGP